MRLGVGVKFQIAWGVLSLIWDIGASC